MRVLVTGAGGFLGGAIARDLVARGDTVVALNRSAYPALDALGVEALRGDLADPDAVARAAEGCDAVVHVAAKAGVWGSHASYFTANVVGTQNIIDACQRFDIPKLVYTSTPSVVHSGGDISGADESLPYPEHFHAPYPETKAEAERRVLAANGTALPGGGTLATVALRPHLIWGPGDNHLVPRIIDRAKRGRLAFVGDGENRVDGVYVDNAADAHIAALDRVAPDHACAGRAYFITNDEPIATKDLINRIVRAGGLPPVERHVPVGVAVAVGGLLEVLFGMVGAKNEPPMTRFVARQLSTEHWYDISAARRDLGYVPRVSTDEGMKRLAEALQG